MGRFLLEHQMRDVNDILQELNTLDEGPHLEAKTASQIGRSILETICAFANKDGGYILCGVVRDKQKLFGYKVQGVNDPDKLMCDVLSAVQGTFSLPVHIDIDRVSVSGGTVVVIAVQRNDGAGLVFFKKDGLPKGAYERRGSSDYQYRFEDMNSLLAKLAAASSEAMNATAWSMDAFDAAVLRDYRSLREKVRGDDHSDMPEREFLQMLAFAEERNGVNYATRPGVIFLGTPSAIRQLIPGSRIFIARMPRREETPCPGQEPLDISYDLQGPAFTYTERAITYILDALPSRTSYSPDSNTRDDLITTRRRIAREVIVNAVAHRDFGMSSCVEILHYANRIEVRNPGASRIPVERLGDGVSDARNPQIVKAFQDVNWAESRGTGIATIRRKMDALGLMAPLFDNDSVCGRFRAILILTPVPESFTSAFGVSLTESQAKLVFAAVEVGNLTISMAQSLLQAREIDVAATLTPLLNLGLLCRTHSNRGTCFEPGPCSLAVQEWLIKGANPGVAPVGRSRCIMSIRDKRPQQACMIISECNPKPVTAGDLARKLALSEIELRTDTLPPLLDVGFIRPIRGIGNQISYIAQPMGCEFLRLQKQCEDCGDWAEDFGEG